MVENQTSKSSLSDLIKAMVIFAVVGGVIVLGVSFALKNILFNDDGGKIVEQPTTIICPKDFSGYESVSQGQTLKLIDRKIPAYAANGQFVNPTVVIAKRGGTGSEVACGYLYVKTGTESDGKLQSWENIYINPNTFGGHIIADKALSLRGDGLTEMLFSLDSISYRPNRDTQEVRTANWVALMNVSDRLEFNISLNTENRTGFIEDISIAYKCFNPETGKETTDCKFDVIERRGLDY